MTKVCCNCKCELSEGGFFSSADFKICDECGRYVCDSCVRETGDKDYCKDCFKKKLNPPSPSGSAFILSQTHTYYYNNEYNY